MKKLEMKEKQKGKNWLHYYTYIFR
jgi:hypothetical protein